MENGSSENEDNKEYYSQTIEFSHDVELKCRITILCWYALKSSDFIELDDDDDCAVTLDRMSLYTRE